MGSVLLNGRLRCFTRYRLDHRSVIRLYNVTDFSYSKTIEVLTTERNQGSLPNLIYHKGNLIARHYNEISKNISDKYPRMLRETLIVKEVSLLEAFFGDLLRELSNVTLDPFKEKKSKELQLARILSTQNIRELQNEIVEDKIRFLNMKGFKVIRNFFLKNVEVDFSSAGVDLKHIEKLYDVRNILVHNDGRIDEYFAHKYSEVVTKKFLVTEEYFIESLNSIYKLIEFIATEIDKKYELPRSKRKKEKEDEIVFRNKVAANFSNIAFRREVMDLYFVFGFDEKYKHKEIFLEIIEDNDLDVIWLVEGNKNQLGTFTGFLKMLKRQGYFVELEITRYSVEESESTE